MSAVTIVSPRSAIAAATARLREAGVETPRVDAEWLLAGLLGLGRASLMANLGRELPSALASRYETFVARRERREPLQHILGWEEFCGLRFTVTADVLVPRPETETLVEWALALLLPAGAGGKSVIDVGTGSGCIACALAAARPDLRVVGVDISPAAVRLARENAFALALNDRVTVVESDLFGSLAGSRFDLVVANPPYLSAPILSGLAPEVVVYEPSLALDGGVDGLRVIRRLVAEAPARLVPGGTLALETAGKAHVTEIAALMGAAGFVNISTRRDLVGIVRFIAGHLPSGDDGGG